MMAGIPKNVRAPEVGVMAGVKMSPLITFIDRSFLTSTAAVPVLSNKSTEIRSPKRLEARPAHAWGRQGVLRPILFPGTMCPHRIFAPGR